ncbi:uncharacterized protein LY89DRAFT_603275 [Mollisia scopiformis]|uniref:Uncharacterized protein n=1 Tax=Mollisia scopiformis TaxID=149040 RepID=A0A132B3L2_MOLSC|nr:uncharacterized protein LY89DRAFT_603275 [Mollisia scopiformis]KUJ06514.1 hypothetical protein LY89DRAFT_603275 [Mollisia scopiformis]
MSLEPTLGNTTCSKGHVHPPWNTTGVLRIAKCESVCGFCQKETKTAANLRKKHVAIHIKNEGLSLTIAEGSSGRGRLEMPSAQLERGLSSSSRFSQDRDDDHSDALSYRRPIGPSNDSFSASSVLMSMSQRSSYPAYSANSSSYPSYTYSSPSTPSPVTAFTHSMSHSPHQHSLAPYAPPQNHGDPFKALREHNISTKSAWTVIPAAEGFRILDLCKSMSVAREGTRGEERIPCYNRETIFDEEWQAHMKDVHGVFLLWPETWMRRIEVLDLDAFGGDIGACNEVIMDS